MEGKPVPVDPDPVFVIEDSGPEAFLDDMDADDMDAAITGRQAGPEEERQDLPVAFIPHRRTCPWADKPAPRRVERGDSYGGLAPAITPELEHRKSGYVERKRRPYQGNVVRIA